MCVCGGGALRKVKHALSVVTWKSTIANQKGTTQNQEKGLSGDFAVTLAEFSLDLVAQNPG